MTGFWIAVLASVALSQGAGEWPVLHNLRQTSFAGGSLLKPPLKVRWIAKVHGTFKSGPVVAEGALAIQSRDGYLICLDAHTGEQRWRYFVKKVPDQYLGGAASGPCISNGRVYAAFHSAGHPLLTGMRCFDINTGRELWKKDVGYTNFEVRYSPQISNGKLFFVSNREVTGATTEDASQLVYRAQLQAWDAATGDTLWTYTLMNGPAYNTSLVVSGDTVFSSVGGPESGGKTGAKTVALDLDGNLLWTSTAHSIAEDYGALQLANGRLVVPYSYAGGIKFLNPSTGALLLSGQGTSFSRVAAFMNGKYWVRGYGGWPEPYSESTGQSLPSADHYSEGFDSGCSPVVAANGFAYVGFGHPGANTPGHQWHAIDETGKSVWNFTSSANNCPTLAIAYDRLYTAGGVEGVVYCFENAQ